jgi:hypothetical protein
MTTIIRVCCCFFFYKKVRYVKTKAIVQYYLILRYYYYFFSKKITEKRIQNELMLKNGTESEEEGDAEKHRHIYEVGIDRVWKTKVLNW